MRTPVRVLVIGAAAAAVAIGGTTAALATGHDDHPARATTTPVGLDAAERTARAAVPGTRVTEAELDHEHGRRVWEFDLTDRDGHEHDVTVDATTGKIVQQGRDHDDHGRDDHGRDHDHDHDDD